MTTHINTPSGMIDSDKLTDPLPDRKFRDAWRLDGTVIDLDLDTMKTIVSEMVKPAMLARIDQGIRWGWSADESEYVISLNEGMRELLASWHQLLDRPIPFENPHCGFIKSNGIIIKGPDGIDLPDEVIVDMAEFAGLWVPKIRQIAIAETLHIQTLDLIELETYDADMINWSIRDDVIAGMTIVDWPAEKTNWSDDLVLYNL